MHAPAQTSHRPLKLLLVDDEPLARARLHAVLDGDADLAMLPDCDDGPSAVKTILNLRPDLVLLDVQMPGLDGFGVIEAVGKERMPDVVFVSAYDAYALRAFEAQAVDYLLKPFDDERLFDVVRRASERVQVRRQGNLVRQFEELMRTAARLTDSGGQSVHGGNEYVLRLTVREEDCVSFVAVHSIDWFESAGNYVRLHAGDRVWRVRQRIGALAARLDPRYFVRIHKETIVNIDRIAEVQPWFGGDYIAVMRDGEKLRVSRTYAPRLVRENH